MSSCSKSDFSAARKGNCQWCPRGWASHLVTLLYISAEASGFRRMDCTDSCLRELLVMSPSLTSWAASSFQIFLRFLLVCISILQFVLERNVNGAMAQQAQESQIYITCLKPTLSTRIIYSISSSSKSAASGYEPGETLYSSDKSTKAKRASSTTSDVPTTANLH